MRITPLFSAVLLMLLSACNKTISELPEATQTGANTFGAKIDGELWAPRGFGPFPSSKLLEARFTTDSTLLINARNFASSPNESGFEIFVTGVRGPGTYVLNSSYFWPSDKGYGYYVKKKFTPQEEWITSPSQTGTVTITKLDLAAEIVSGTFEFHAGNLSDPHGSIHVTEGRFDIRYKN